MALSNGEMPAHPDLNAIAAFADSGLSAADRAALVDHLTGCAECRTTLAALARGLPRPVRSGRTMTWFALAATLMLATTVGTVVWRTERGPQTQPVTTPVVPTPVAPASPQAFPVAPTPAVDAPSLTERRGAAREINGKTFRLVAGEWLDSAYDPLGLLPVERVDTSESRAAVLARIPALKAFADLGPRVLVVQDGVVYRFDLPTGPPTP